MTKDEFNVLSEKVDSIQKGLDQIDRDLGKDREDIQQMTIRLGAVEGQVDELRKQLRTHADKIGDRVAEAAQPIIDEAHDLRQEIKDKKIIVKIKTLPLWNFWERR